MLKQGRFLPGFDFETLVMRNEIILTLAFASPHAFAGTILAEEQPVIAYLTSSEAVLSIQRLVATTKPMHELYSWGETEAKHNIEEADNANSIFRKALNAAANNNELTNALRNHQAQFVSCELGLVPDTDLDRPSYDLLFVQCISALRKERAFVELLPGARTKLPLPDKGWSVHYVHYTSENEARTIQTRFEHAGIDATVTKTKRNTWSVDVGHNLTRAKAEDINELVRRRLNLSGVLVLER